MQISGAIPQLRTTDLAESVRFYTTTVGLTLEFQYEDFYAGIRAGSQLFHLKLVDERDPSIEFVERPHPVFRRGPIGRRSPLPVADQPRVQ